LQFKTINFSVVSVDNNLPDQIICFIPDSNCPVQTGRGVQLHSLAAGQTCDGVRVVIVWLVVIAI
jgi:hypothetical protein